MKRCKNIVVIKYIKKSLKEWQKKKCIETYGKEEHYIPAGDSIWSESEVHRQAVKISKGGYLTGLAKFYFFSLLVVHGYYILHLSIIAKYIYHYKVSYQILK
jgi:hypothetical protein